MKRLICFLGVIVGLVACGERPHLQSTMTKNSPTGTQIIGGEKVLDGDPFALSTAVLYIDYSSLNPGTNGLENFCTGTLIHSKFILTAAHCFADVAAKMETDVEFLRKAIRVGFGIPLYKEAESPDLVFRNIRRVTIHPEYVVGSVKRAETEPMFDIALIELDARAPGKARTVPISRGKSFIKRGLEITLVGFGLTKTKPSTKAVQMMKVDVSIDNPAITEAQFTYKFLNGRGACFGDSGGPAYFADRSGNISVVGITSWGDGDCSEMGVYTSVPYFAAWIDSVLSTP